MSPVSNVQRKSTWYILFGGFIFAIAAFTGMVYMLASEHAAIATSSSLGIMRPIVYGLAVLSLLGAIHRIRFGAFEELSIPRFQTKTILSLAFSEACTIFGLLLFFLGAPPAEYLRFALGTLAVNFLVILPVGNRYWSLHR
jgi:hypothetical protein